MDAYCTSYYVIVKIDTMAWIIKPFVLDQASRPAQPRLSNFGYPLSSPHFHQHGASVLLAATDSERRGFSSPHGRHIDASGCAFA